MSEDAAQRFMAVASRFGEIPQFAVFKPSVLYALASPSTPDSVVEKAIEKAESGESVTKLPRTTSTNIRMGILLKILTLSESRHSSF